MNSDQFRRYLAKQGATFEHGARHLHIRLGDRTSVMPIRGGGKRLGTGLMRKIKKDLGIE